MWRAAAHSCHNGSFLLNWKPRSTLPPLGCCSQVMDHTMEKNNTGSYKLLSRLWLLLCDSEPLQYLGDDWHDLILVFDITLAALLRTVRREVLAGEGRTALERGLTWWFSTVCGDLGQRIISRGKEKGWGTAPAEAAVKSGYISLPLISCSSQDSQGGIYLCSLSFLWVAGPNEILHSFLWGWSSIQESNVPE